MPLKGFRYHKGDYADMIKVWEEHFKAMNDNMVARVATAIGNCGCDTDWDDCLEFARAAIAALREPTAGMVEKGLFDDEGFNLLGVHAADFQKAWTRMIDAALAGEAK